VLNGAWELRYGGSGSLVDFSGAVQSTRVQLTALPEVFTEEIGVFGWLQVRLPALAYTAWWWMLLSLVTIAFLVGRAAERLAIALAIGAAVAAPVALWVAVYHWTTFGVQGRYVLPAAVMVPMLAAEMAFRNQSRVATLNSRNLVTWYAVPAATLQLLAWYLTQRRFAENPHGPLLFLFHSVWAPAAGWWPWVACAVAGCVAVALTDAGPGVWKLGSLPERWHSQRQQ
jgi:hypothetical protein